MGPQLLHDPYHTFPPAIHASTANSTTPLRSCVSHGFIEQFPSPIDYFVTRGSVTGLFVEIRDAKFAENHDDVNEKGTREGCPTTVSICRVMSQAQDPLREPARAGLRTAA